MNSQTIRIVTLDSYMSSPIQGLDVLYSEFRGSSVSQVPVLRLFGSIPTGEKICVHIHGVFPYLYIPFDGTEDANSLMYKIAADIDKAVNISLNQATSHMHHIYKITLVQGIPMYGYHNKEHQFFKIHVYNPILMRKVTALLMNESTLGKLYQPHEAHLNFTLQFMIDYNLHGMSNMILSKMKYRQGSKEINVDPEFLLPASVGKITICELEGDCLAEDILNREEVAFGNIGANPGIATLWADEQQRRRNKGLDSQIEHLLELKRTNIPPTNSHLSYKQALRERLAVFSNEKNIVEKINSSVYPAESPSNVQIQNASMIESQSTTDVTDSSMSLDETLEPSRLSITFDEDAQKLLQILIELEQTNEKLEEDSILTQLTKEDQEENQKEIEENELDFSMSIEDVTTPTKIMLEKHDEEADDDDDVLNTTLIPQLDGCCDENTEMSSSLLEKQIHRNGSCKTLRNTRSLTKIGYIKIQNIGRDMPILDQDYPPIENSTLNKSLLTVVPYSFAIVPKKKNLKAKKRITHLIVHKNKKCVKRRKLTRKEKKERDIKNKMVEVKQFENKIKKLKRQDLLAAVMKKLHKKENELILFLAKNRQPRFRVIPKDQVKGLLSKKFVDETQTSKVKILSDIIVKISNYTEPTLHLTIKYPNRCYFLYTYHNGFVPEATKIPRKISSSCNKLDLETYVKQYSINKVEDTKINQKSLEIEEKRDTSDYIKKIEQIDKFEVKEETYLFSNDYLSDVKDPNILIDMHRKTDDDLIKMAENLREQLKTHITILQSPKSIEQDTFNFSCEVERINVLDTIKCLKSEENDNTFENNNNNIINFNAIEDSNNNFMTEIFESESTKSKTTNAQNNMEIDSFQISNRQLKKKVFKEPSRRSERIKNQQNCLSLDGTVDDSSSEEEKPILRRSSRTTRYKALPITLEKSPKAINSVDKEPAVKDLVSFTETEEKEAPSISRLSKNPVCDMNVKRQLFEQDSNPPFDKTIFEEKLACCYSSNISRTKPSTRNIIDNVNENSSFHEEASNSSTIFSTDSEKSFFNHHIINNRLTTAEKYDIDTNYKAKEGCSKFLTPLTSQDQASSSQDKPSSSQDKASSSQGKASSSQDKASSSQDKASSSQNKANSSQVKTQILSDSLSSELLTPYQKMESLPSIAEKETVPDMYLQGSINKASSSKVKTQILSDSLSSELLTLYQKMDSLQSIAEKETVTDVCLQGIIKMIVPKFSAPTRKEVLKSLDDFKIPHVSKQLPYYSNIEDVTRSFEVGFNTLKINSLSTAHLPDFESQSDILNKYRTARLDQLHSSIKLTKSNMNNVILSYCRNKDCVITPIKKPPNLKMIKDWLAQKSKKVTTPKNLTRVKIRVPVSPGAESDDEDLDLTLSPLTPKSVQSSQVASENTPKSSLRSTSPIFGNRCKKRKKEIRTKILSQSFKTSLSLSQENSTNNSGQITGVTIHNSYLNRSVQNLQNARAIIEHQNLTVLVMELHICTRGEFKPDPVHDSIRALFYSILHDVPEPNLKGRNRKGVIAINNLPLSTGTTKVPILDGIGINCDITYVNSEENLITEFLKICDFWDPDIYAGYEIELLSWGYLIERSSVLGINLKPLLGRTRQDNHKQRDDDTLNELKLTGRIVLDVWRLMRHEIALQSYTFESVSYHILQKRLPYYSFKDLSFWWDHRTQLHRHKTMKYYLTRVVTVLELFDKLDFLGRTSELARLFGILFFEVLSRGSQFRVESMMLRLAKPLNFIAVSPSVQQRAHMKAPEYIALVMEPESKMYNDPVIVLDFQSLYPSIIIAYNYCFTTCVGRVESLGKSGPFEFGAVQLKVSRSRLKKLLERNQLNFSPCGVGFVKKEVRDGIMPRMLREILDTRLMVKNSMKENKDDKLLQRVLHNRQLGLKLIANVTYGYTAANFSGRMPAVELGDSVVSKGRETLQRAVEMVDNTPEWGARVVYGDTDSLFVLVPGRTKEHAFEVGKQIAEAVTNANPDPIKLKLEKVYQPCILQTKKRYVGYMYEGPEQTDPVYDAKGIETVRRDGCPAVSKMLEKCLRILFETKDVSLVKTYVLKQFKKIIAGRASIQDLTFAKEYRGATGYRPTACVPALELAKKWTAVDKRNEPRSGERVPYVIVNGPPGMTLIRMVKSPRDLLTDSSLKPNAIYYITRVIIPPINRCFNLIGADVHTWFNQMPRKKTQYFASSVSPKKKTTISQYFSTSSCVCCEETQTREGICQNCSNRPQYTVVTLMEKMRIWETNYQNIIMICNTCTSSTYEVRCTSLDCPMYYRRVQTSRDQLQTTFVRELLSSCDF